MATELKKQDVKNIVRDEIKKFVSSELEKEITKSIKSGQSKKEVGELIRNALIALYRFMWIRKDVWGSDVKAKT